MSHRLEARGVVEVAGSAETRVVTEVVEEVVGVVGSAEARVVAEVVEVEVVAEVAAHVAVAAVEGCSA